MLDLLKKQAQIAIVDGDGNEGEKDEENLKKGVSFFKLQYSLLTSKEIGLVALATFLSFASGVSMPAFMLVFGEIINSFSMTSSPDGGGFTVDTINQTCLYFVYIGIAMLVVSALSITIWTSTGKLLSRRIMQR